MADLGNLWFSLGLDDSKFEKQWKAAFNKYKNDAKINVDFKIDSNAIKELQKFKDAGFTNKQARSYAQLASSVMKMAREQEKYNRELEKTKALQNESQAKIARQNAESTARINRQDAESLKRQTLTQAKINNYINSRANANNRVTKGYQDQSQWLQNLKTLASNYFSLYAVKNFVTELAQVSGEFEKQRVTLQAMVGEMEGLEIYGKMKELAVVSPFEFKDLSSYAKQLAAFSVPYEELYDTTKRLADISAGLGVDMSRIILAYGQIRSARVLKGTELRQLTEAGVPILEKLAEKFEQLEGKAVSVSDVFGKISKKMVSFEMVKDIFTDMTSEGGKFYNMQEIQAETLAGKISNLKDAYSIMLSEIGESNEDTLKGGVEWLYKLIDNWETIGRVVITVAKSYGVYQAVQAVAFAGSKLKLLGSFAEVFFRMHLNISKAARAMSMMNLATKAGAWGALLAAIAGIGVALQQTYVHLTKFNREMQEIASTELTGLQNEIDKLNELTKAIQNTAEGTDERKKLIGQLNSQYGQYIGNILDEHSALLKVEQAQRDIVSALRDRAKEEAFIRMQQSINDDFAKSSSAAISSMITSLEARGFSTTIASKIVRNIREAIENNPDISMDDIFGGLLKDFDILEVGRIREILGSESGIQGQAVKWKQISNLAKAIKLYNEQTQKAKSITEVMFGESLKDYSAEFNRITASYKQVLSFIDSNDTLSTEDKAQKKQQAQITYLNTLIDLYKYIPSEVVKYRKQLEELTKTESAWRTNIAKITAGFNDAEKGIIIPTIFNPKQDESWLAYVDRIKKEYEEIKDDIANIGSDPDKELPALKAQQAALEAIAKAYKLILDEKGNKKASTEADKAEKDRVNALKEEYNWVLKVYDAYKKYREQGLSEGDAKSSVIANFEDLPDNILAVFQDEHIIEEWFVEEMRSIAAVAAKNGSDVGEKFSSAVLRKLGGIKSEEVIAAINFKKEIEDELKKWGLEDFTLQGQGVTLDISKALREQAVADNEAFAKRKELLDKIAKAEKGDIVEIAALREMYGDDWLQKAKDRANELYNLEIANNKKVAQEKINDLAKSYANENMDKVLGKGFMNNLASKSISQLTNKRDALLGLLQSKPNISEDLKKQLDDAGISLDEFIKSYNEFILLEAKDISAELWKDKKEKILATGQALSSLLVSMAELSEGSGNDNLANFSKGLSEVLDFALEIGNALDYDEQTVQIKAQFSDIISLIAQVGVGVFNYFQKSKQLAYEAEASFVAFSNAIRLANTEAIALDEQMDTIFGNSAIKSLELWGKQIEQTWNNITDSIANAGNTNLSGGRFKNSEWEYWYEHFKEMEGLGSKIAGMTYSLGKKRFLFWDTTRYSTIGAQFKELFNEDGGLNFDYLDEFLDTAKNLDSKQREFFQNLLDNYELYKEALGNINDYISGIFSDTASTIADRMMESFAITGDAATDLGDLVSNVAKGMAKDLIQSLLIDRYLTPAMDRIKSLYNPQDKSFEEDATLRTQKAILAMQDAMAAAQLAVPEVNKLLQGIQDMGIDLSTESNKASEVLSGLTEDQQNLLVAYINGIRSDVSINKGLLTTIVNSVGTISNNIATAIVVWKQIEANTHRSADGVDRIIGFFESVMGPYDGGGGQAFRVNIA